MRAAQDTFWKWAKERCDQLEFESQEALFKEATQCATDFLKQQHMNNAVDVD